MVELEANQKYPAHIPQNSAAHLHMILREGFIILNGKEHKYKAGDSFKVDKKVSHGFKVKVQTLFLSIQKPAIIDPKTGKIDVKYI